MPEGRNSKFNRARPWLLVLLAIVVGMSLPILIESVVGPRPFVFALPAVIVVALYLGVVPALLTAIGCAMWALMPLVGPRMHGPADFVAMGVFLSLSFGLSILCGRVRNAARRAPRAVTDDAAPRTKRLSGSSPRTTLLSWLTASMYASVLLPLGFFVTASWYGYQEAFQKAGVEIDRANAMADQLLQNSLQASLATLARMHALVGQSPDSVLKPREKELHEHLIELAAGRRDTQAIWIWGADGRAVATNRFYPVPQDTVITDREYFRVHRDRPQEVRGFKGHEGLYISDILFGRISAEHFFNISERRNLADGSFGGIVSVSMYPSFFSSTYATMARDRKDLTISLARADGKILARWPMPQNGSGAAPMGPEAMQAVKNGAASGVFFRDSSQDSQRRMVSFRKIGDWPIYVFAGLSYQTILADWYRFVLVIAGFSISTAIGLSYVSSVALRLARREQAAQSELQTENARRLHAEEALFQAQKLEALGQLTGGVAHDVNNLLMVIGTNTHVHRLLVPQVGRDNAQLAAIDRAVAAGAKLTRQLLSFSRRQTLAPEVVNLQERLSSLLNLVRTSLGSGIELKVDIAPDTRPVCLDVVDFELALINLALNAKDAMGHGTVSISVANGRPGDLPSDPNRETVVVRFSDNGPGVPASTLPRLFEPFFTTKPPGKGTGLGLSQVYGFCAQAGGLARIESEPGAGMAVLMYFPVAHEDQSAQRTQTLPAPAESLRGNILLVEDNDEVGASTVSLLQSLGMTVRRAVSADEACEILWGESEARFDIVLSDIFMPGKLNGIDLALRLQQEKPDLPVVLMTGYAAEEHKAVAAGLKVLAKPFSPELLLAALVAA